MDLIFDPAAEVEIDEAVVHYQAIDPSLGCAFFEEVEDGSRRTLAYPHVWQCVMKDFRRFNLRRFPYAIIYSLETDHGYVLAVMHERRRPHYWLERDKN